MNVYTAKAYNKKARAYEQRWAAYLQHTHDTFLKYLDLDYSETDRILDLSCGTGLLAGRLLEKSQAFGQLVLNDPAQKMLEIAKNRFRNYPDVSFSNAPAHDLPFEDNSFTLIFSLNALHNYEHQQTVITEVRRLLKPGGRFYVQDWNRSGFFRPVNALIRRWVPEHIDTRSLEEAGQMLKEHHFLPEQEESWNYRHWKFFFIKARLMDAL